jgi:hypothetical protein
MRDAGFVSFYGLDNLGSRFVVVRAVIDRILAGDIDPRRPGHGALGATRRDTANASPARTNSTARA